MRALVTLLVFSLALCAGCRRQESQTSAAPGASPPVSAAPPTAPGARISAIDLGNALGSDGRVSTPTSVFTPTDTIYASVLTEGQQPGATLSARWSYQDGQVVSENRETLGSSGRVNTEFHIAKPDGWPAGRYRLEIALNGQPAGSRDFEVR